MKANSDNLSIDRTTETGSPACGTCASGANEAAGQGYSACGESWCPHTLRTDRRRRVPKQGTPRFLIPLVVLASFSALFVGAEVVQSHLLPDISIGMRHLLLTIRAAVVTVVVSALVFWVMLRQQKRLAATATQLTRLLEAYQQRPEAPGRFENPSLFHCREVLACERKECPMYSAPGQRCWQVMALHGPGNGKVKPLVTLKQCQECEVYQLSCPNEMAELGEGLNNLLYLLEQGAGQIGDLRNQVLEKQKMAAIGQIAAGVAHEICNPLSSISSVVQMLRRDKNGAPRHDQLDVIDTHIQRISGVVRQLTELARPGADTWTQVDIGRLLDQAVRLVQFNPRARAATIDCHHPADLPLIFGKPMQLQQMIIHLALNALDAMPSGGILTLEAGASEEEIHIQVRDTGCGIAEDVGRRIFEPYYTTKEPGQGTGMGLAVCYGIIQEHGGTIDFSSSLGEGTVFTVTLPISERSLREHDRTEHRAACR